MNAFVLLSEIFFMLSGVSVEPSTDPNVVAVVTFKNTPTNTSWDNERKTLILKTEELGEIQIGVEFTYNAADYGADRITIYPPMELVCDPASCEVEVLEHFNGKIKLLHYNGF